LRERLRGPVGEGFEHTKSSIEASIAEATPHDRRKTSKSGGDAVEAALPSELPQPNNEGGAANRSEEQAS
jgi:hypothetical protein